MMDKQEFRTRIGSRVRIRDSVTHMYPNARVYNEAIVRARKRDQLGYPIIYVEWDKDHWAYSGEEDGWAIEAHFDLVEDQMAEDKRFNELLGGLSDLVNNFKSEGETPDESKEKLEIEPQEESKMTYNEVLDRALEDARDGEAFIVLVARPQEFRGNQIITPHMYKHSKREDADMMLEAVMADIASQAYTQLVMQLIAERKRDGSSGS